MQRIIAIFAVMTASAVFAEVLPGVVELTSGEYGGHPQDVCRDGDFLYWAHTRTILKTDFSGRVVASVRDPDHNAGCRVKDGKLYVAVCRVGGHIKLDDRKKCQLQINIYDANDLHLIERKVIEGAYDRAGSLEVLPDGSFVVGCLRPPEVREDQVRFYHLSKDFKVLSRHEIDNMKVKLGIEVIKYYDGDLYCFIYGGDTVRIDAKTFEEKGRIKNTEGQLGAVIEKDGFWTCTYKEEKGESGKLVYKSKIVKRRPITAE